MRKRKIKFALELKDGEEARSMEELRAHFDLEKIICYFQDGKLVEWLDDHFYTDEADEIRSISNSDPQLGKKICEILRVEYTEVGDAETIAWRKGRLDKLKQYTADPGILEQVDVIAFDQDDLEDIIREENTDTIYLCNNTFVFPSGLKKENIRYIGIGKNVAVNIQSKELLNFEALGIVFENVQVSGIKVKNTNESKCEVVSNAEPITLANLWRFEEENNVPWYKRAFFLSEYIYELLNSDIVSDTRIYKTNGMQKFLFNHTLGTAPSYINQIEEIVICEIKHGDSVITFTNKALYMFFIDTERIPFCKMDDIQVDKNTHTVGIYCSNKKYYRIFCEMLCNPVAIKVFLKVAAGIDEFRRSEFKIINSQKMRLLSLGGKTIGERMQIDTLL